MSLTLRAVVLGLACAGATTPISAQPPTELRGAVTVRYGGAEVSRCVPDVGAALAALDSRGEVLGFRMNGATDVARFRRHWQGVQRLTTGDGHWLALSRSGADIALVMARMESRPSSGVAFGSGDDAGRPPKAAEPPASDRIVLEVPGFPEADHGGGMQVVGSVLVAPYEARGDHAEIVFWDVADPAAPRILHRIERTRALPSSAPGHASGAGIVRLADGRYLLVVGARSSKSLDFYLTAGTSLRDSTLELEYRWTVRGDVVGGFQNLNLVVQCDGALYLIGTHNTAIPPPSLGDDMVHWYRLSLDASGFRLAEEGGRRLVCRRCNFAAAAGVHVDPDGRILLYSAPHDNDGPGGSVDLEEFAPVPRILR
jgi:hypothetical protein